MNEKNRSGIITICVALIAIILCVTVCYFAFRHDRPGNSGGADQYTNSAREYNQSIGEYLGREETRIDSEELRIRAEEERVERDAEAERSLRESNRRTSDLLQELRKRHNPLESDDSSVQR